MFTDAIVGNKLSHILPVQVNLDFRDKHLRLLPTPSTASQFLTPLSLHSVHQHPLRLTDQIPDLLYSSLLKAVSLQSVISL